MSFLKTTQPCCSLFPAKTWKGRPNGMRLARDGSSPCRVRAVPYAGTSGAKKE